MPADRSANFADAAPPAIPGEWGGERILLRPWRTDDDRALWEAVDSSRERLRVWMPWVDGYRSIEDARAFIGRSESDWTTRANLFTAIVERATGAILGGTGFNEPDWAIRSFEIGYWLRDGAEGHGHVTEAVRLLTRIAFDRLGANRLEIRCDPANARSRAVPERLGFTLEGRLRNNMADRHGGPRDTLVFSLVPGDPGSGKLGTKDLL